jgi:AcrR family transcriptional regulator
MSRSNIKKYHFSIKKFHDGLQGVKGQILLGAFQNIVDVGIAATTIRRIASKAGINPGIIHYYFENKEDLLSQVLMTAYQGLISNIKALSVSDLSPIEKMEALFVLGNSLFEDRRDEWIVITSFWAYSMSGHSDMLSLHRKLNRRFRAELIKLLRKLTAESASRISKDIAPFLTGAIEGLALQYVLDPKGFDPKGALDLLRGVIVKAIRKTYNTNRVHE